MRRFRLLFGALMLVGLLVVAGSLGAAAALQPDGEEAPAAEAAPAEEESNLPALLIGAVLLGSGVWAYTHKKQRFPGTRFRD